MVKEKLLIEKKQMVDAGMALALILLLIGLILKQNVFFVITVFVLILTMTIPIFLKPFAFSWFKFSHLLGTISSKILLSIIFFLMVIPIGFVRKIMGYDSLNLNKFKSGSDSVFKHRDYKFTKKDLEKPF